ncbi:Crp/Fnr family transcriptional regulator [Exilibacterium tricleocarpae]|nr:Crp/Fnr family transcriptional regulator [Exilibacterium tricleocarpae]
MLLQDKLEILQTDRWFSQLPEPILAAVAQVMKAQALQDGELIFAKGDSPTGLYCIVSGNVKVCSLGGDGREHLLAYLETGNWFGEISLFDGLSRTHHTYAAGHTQLLLLPQKDFHAMLAIHPELYPLILKLLCKRLRLTLSYIEDAAFLTLRARLAKRILHLTEYYGKPSDQGIRIGLHVSQEELGKMLVTSRQSISKELSQWQKEGVILVEYGHLTVRDIDKLKVYSQKRK